MSLVLAGIIYLFIDAVLHLPELSFLLIEIAGASKAQCNDTLLSGFLNPASLYIERITPEAKWVPEVKL